MEGKSFERLYYMSFKDFMYLSFFISFLNFARIPTHDWNHLT